MHFSLFSSIKWRHTIVLLTAIQLSSCTTPPVISPPEKSKPLALQQAPNYRIDPSASTLHILVYRGGIMARLGHNHVVTSHTVSGQVWWYPAPKQSGFAIQVPVNDLIVDDDAARSEEGADFPLNVKAEAKLGTRKNMLSAALLDAANYPLITIKSVSINGETNTPLVTAALQIKNQTREITLPVTLEAAQSHLRVKGEFDIKQTDFGITPLSVAGGALQVVDTVKIKFDLVAVSSD